MVLRGGPGRVEFHQNALFLVDFHEVPLNFMEMSGNAWNSMQSPKFRGIPLNSGLSRGRGRALGQGRGLRLRRRLSLWLEPRA